MKIGSLSISWGEKRHEQITTESIMTPSLTLVGYVTPASLACAAGLAIAGYPLLSLVPLVLAIAPVISAIYVNIHFTKADPDRLQSERHRSVSRALEIVEKKGQKLIPVSASDLTLMTNPYPAQEQKQIKGPEGTEQNKEPEGTEQKKVDATGATNE